ncbi:TolC family outer membrane protein [Agarivorans sp. 1_MG-2023]|uniref:TolC family outer membrane protein n=1 Tax=Agarivorans sp. 1_MG-2023 TaxID=3062634 RepID=UPI0026E24776|nr:TolC family outer membrane protein [Agarivorans sp. 1_MG-2023]MDO6764467.1 TolC family outer membrane protein [Agarivorans sp. 1_MG-2023]
MNKLSLTLASGLLMGSNLACAQSLEQAVAKVLTEHPQLQSSFNQFKASTEQYQGAKGGYYPTVDLTAGAGWARTETEEPQVESGTPTEVGVSIRQLLFSGFATTGEVSRTENEARADQWLLYNDAENIALRVVDVYLEVVKQEQLLELADSNLQTHLAIQKDIKKRTDSGVGSSADLTQVNGRVARATTNALSAKNNLLDAQTQFLRVVNTLPNDLVLPGADIALLPADLDAALAAALDVHPTLKAAQFDVAAANAQNTVAKASNYPEIAVELDGNWDNNRKGYDDTKDYELAAMLRLRYNLFNGGSDAAEIRRSAYDVNRAKAVGDDAHRQVTEGTRLAWNAWDVLVRQKSFLQQHVEASFQTVEAYKKQFNLGKRSLLDVLNTENELFEAQNEFIGADIDELRAKYRLLNATGLLLEALRVNRPEDWNF